MNNQMPNYWSPDSKAELELLIQWKDEIIPIEVKAENCISGRSLSVYNDKYHPLHRIRPNGDGRGNNVIGIKKKPDLQMQARL